MSVLQVVADRDKFEMDQEVEQEVFLKTNERFDVETRRGSPMDVSDLQRAGEVPILFQMHTAAPAVPALACKHVTYVSDQCKLLQKPEISCIGHCHPVFSYELLHCLGALTMPCALTTRWCIHSIHFHQWCVNVGVGWASTVFVMLPGQDTTVSPRGRVVPEVATLTQRNALKVSTALRVSSLRGPASEANGGQGTQEQRLVLQDCSGGVTEIGYADKFLRYRITQYLSECLVLGLVFNFVFFHTDAA